MKQKMRNLISGFLAATVAMTVVATPLTANLAYAAEKTPPAPRMEKEQHRDVGNQDREHHERDQRPDINRHGDQPAGLEENPKENSRNPEHHNDIDRRHDNGQQDQHQDKEWRHDRDRQDQHHDREWRPDRRDRRDRLGAAFWIGRMEMYRQWLLNSQSTGQSPVDAVIKAADVLGFDAYADSFSLISQGPSMAAVQVIHDGVSYTVTLYRQANGYWYVYSVN